MSNRKKANSSGSAPKQRKKRQRKGSRAKTQSQQQSAQGQPISTAGSDTSETTKGNIDLVKGALILLGTTPQD